MRRLVLASCDIITLKTHFINAVKAAINEGEPAMNTVTIGMDLGDKINAVYILDNSGREVLSDTRRKGDLFFANIYLGLNLPFQK